MASKNQRARAAEALKKQQRKERARQLTIGGVIVGLLALIVGVGFWIQNSRDTSGQTAKDVPQGLAADGYGVVVGNADAPNQLTIYEDLQCPVCNAFEGEVGDEIDQAVADGKIGVEYRLVSFLDGQSTTQYSSRALNALMVVLNAKGVETFQAYRKLLFANQPAEGSAGLTDDQLIDLAVQAGADKATISGPIKDKIYEQWIVNATDQMSKNKVNGTPTVFLGEEMATTPQAGVVLVRKAIG